LREKELIYKYNTYVPKFELKLYVHFLNQKSIKAFFKKLSIVATLLIYQALFFSCPNYEFTISESLPLQYSSILNKSISPKIKANLFFLHSSLIVIL